MDNDTEIKDAVPETGTEGQPSMLAKIRKFFSVKTSVIIAAVVVIGALAFYYKGLFIAATVNGVPISRLSIIEQLEKSSGKATLEAIAGSDSYRSGNGRKGDYRRR